MADGLRILNAGSECSDCRRCWRGQAETDQDRLQRIVQEVVLRVRGQASMSVPRMVPVGVSVRHAHLSREALDELYGPGSELTKMRDLYQPGAWAAEQTVTVLGPRMRAIERIRVLAPLRDYVQLEMSRTDGILLGVDLPVRESGDLEGATRITLVGPKGSLTVSAAIRATRHLHLGPQDVLRMGLQGVEGARVRTKGPKALLFENVSIKVSDEFVPELHLDTDDANAADLVCSDPVEIVT